MKRLRTILLFLLLGAVVNVAVAWGCSIWSMPGGHSTRYYDTPDQELKSLVPKAWLKKRMDRHLMAEDKPGLADAQASGFGVRVYGVFSKMLGHRAEDFVLHVQEAGWPWRSLYCNSYMSRDALDERMPPGSSMGSTPVAVDWIGGIRAPDILHPNEHCWDYSRFHIYHYPLPLLPMWPGFAFNSILFAAPLWSFIAGPFALRRITRRKRGLCGKCAYDLKGAEHEVCPECGSEVQPQ